MLTQRLFTPRLASERCDRVENARAPDTLVRNDTRPKSERTQEGRDAGNGNEFEARSESLFLSDVDP